MSKNHILTCFILLLMLVTLSIPAKAGLNNIIENDDGSISIKKGRTTLSDFFSYLSEVKGIRIYVIEELDSDLPINLDINTKSIEEILGILLKNHDYAIVYNNQQVKEIEEWAGNAISNQTKVDQINMAPSSETDKSKSRHLMDQKIDHTVDQFGKNINIATIFSESGEILSQISVKSSTLPSSSPQQRPIEFYNPTNHPSHLKAISKKQIIQGQIDALNSRIASGISDREYEKWVSVRGEKYVTHDRDRLVHLQKQLNSL